MMFGILVGASDQNLRSDQFAAIEHDLGGRVGVAALDTGNGETVNYRAEERFPMCSTFKFLLVAAIFSLNSAIPGDERDTTTPAAITSDLKLLLLGDRLSEDSRNHLEAWLAGNKTGAKRILAGLPPAWRR
jgi:beta-lactamase class A